MTGVEVLILGAGPAGAATAIALRRLGVAVAIVEAGMQPRPRLGETLPAKALPLLDHLDVGHTFRRQGHLPVQAIRSAWGGPALQDRLALFDPHGHGWHLDRRRFDTLLWRAAQERGADIWTGTRVVDIQRPADPWRLRLRSAGGDTTVHADFLIDATGRRGFVARRLARRPLPWDRLIGLARRYPGAAGSAQPWTLVEAVRQGWWYSAPLPDGDLLVVFLTDADLIGVRAEWARAWPSWLAEASHTHSRLRGRGPRSDWQVQSAASCHTAPAPGEPWLAVGDAALACDPLAGCGLTLALETGLAAAHALGEWRMRSARSLQRYAQALNTFWQDYWQQRTAIYQTETRWADAPFWHRRHHANKLVAARPPS
jgi:2-polyprenyl-6-methoxyphenol hydroxylase-like FAD-dependent oxidoreductase